MYYATLCLFVALIFTVLIIVEEFFSIAVMQDK